MEGLYEKVREEKVGEGKVAEGKGKAWSDYGKVRDGKGREKER